MHYANKWPNAKYAGCHFQHEKSDFANSCNLILSTHSEISADFSFAVAKTKNKRSIQVSLRSQMQIEISLSWRLYYLCLLWTHMGFTHYKWIVWPFLRRIIMSAIKYARISGLGDTNGYNKTLTGNLWPLHTQSNLPFTLWLGRPPDACSSGRNPSNRCTLSEKVSRPNDTLMKWNILFASAT